MLRPPSRTTDSLVAGQHIFGSATSREQKVNRSPAHGPTGALRN